MKEISQSTRITRIKHVLSNGIFLGIVFSLIKNRAIVWSILNGNTSNLNTLMMDSCSLTIGGTLGYYIIFTLEAYFKKNK